LIPSDIDFMMLLGISLIGMILTFNVSFKTVIRMLISFLVLFKGGELETPL